MDIITHRGLDPSKENYFAESSREAFADQLARGFGLEFDPRRAPDGRIVVAHRAEDITSLGSSLVTFRELLQMIAESKSKALHAIHLKADVQERQFLNEMCRELQEADTGRFIFFDLTIPSAEYLKRRDGRLHLALSVSHSYDILRYSNAVGGTLFSLHEALSRRDLFDWVWLDEWDRSDLGGGTKKLYARETFTRFRKAGFKIALVTPELHATSPHLLGGEAHQDAATKTELRRRFEEIIALRPDAVCTDYPDFVWDLVHR